MNVPKILFVCMCSEFWFFIFQDTQQYWLRVYLKKKQYMYLVIWKGVYVYGQFFNQIGFYI
jgi:hypothetical protein